MDFVYNYIYLYIFLYKKYFTRNNLFMRTNLWKDLLPELLRSHTVHLTKLSHVHRCRKCKSRHKVRQCFFIIDATYRGHGY